MGRIQREWIRIPESARLLIVTALLREGQLEAAQLDLSSLQADNVDVPIWIWTLLADAYCARHDYEALICLLYDLYDKQIELPRQTLLYLLREAINDNHVPTVNWIWMKHVQPGFIRPDAECCRAVLRLRSGQDLWELKRRASAYLQQLDRLQQTKPVQADTESRVANLPTHESLHSQGSARLAYDGSDQADAAPGTEFWPRSLDETPVEWSALQADSRPPPTDPISRSDNEVLSSKPMSPWLRDAPLPEEGFFDPKEALAKEPHRRYLNPRWLANREKYHAYIRDIFGKGRKY